jgi:outer membrane protein assembly factor BamB
MDSGPNITNELISLIATGSGPVLFAPRWGSDVVALDPTANGRLLWASPKGSSPNASASLIGADSQRVYTWGDEGKAINIADGRPVWQWSVPDNGQAAGSPGVPALCGDRLYVPVRDKLYVLSATDRKELEVLELATKADDFAGSNFWGVMAVNGMLLAMSDERVIAYGAPDK